MTTTVRILIEGNKVCEVQTIEILGDGAQRAAVPSTYVKPGQWVSRMVHGTQQVRITEVGEFLKDGA